MINSEEFKKNATEFIAWIADYLANVENFPVRAQTRYGDIRKRITENPPLKGESITSIFSDFTNIILPGITHWQSPNYFAYFPANSSEPSLLAEFLTAALGVQGMKWITSPAATELEEQMMIWLRGMLGLPEKFTGVIQDTASVATLCAILAARERTTGNRSNLTGVNGTNLRVYCSAEAHSSIEKAVRIAGIGSENLVKIEVDELCRMVPEKLEKAIEEDIRDGLRPCCIVAALGTTGTCATDPLEEIGRIANHYNIWLHVDAAFAGTALILPEVRKTIRGLDKADSFVFNPHKWMFTNFDCSAFFVRDKEQLNNTFTLVPAYLQTTPGTESNDYSNYGIQLGRRFRSLKLWFVIRNFGVEGIQERIREHIRLAGYFEEWVRTQKYLELIVPRNLTVVCFRYNNGKLNEADLNTLNAGLLEKINATGRLFMSHTLVGGKYCLRFVCAQTNTAMDHVRSAIGVINGIIGSIEKS